MAKQTMEGRRFAKSQFAVCAGLTAGAAALNGWLLLREAAGKQPVSTLLSLGAVCVLLILLGQLWAWSRAMGPSLRKAIMGRNIALSITISIAVSGVYQVGRLFISGQVGPGWELLPFLLPSGAVVLLFELNWRRFKRLGDRRKA